MLFLGMMKARAGGSQDLVARRMQWNYPEGIRVVAEYVLMTNDPYIVAVIEADDLMPVMMGMSEWDDLFDITYYPAINAEDVMEKVKQAMG